MAEQNTRAAPGASSGKMDEYRVKKPEQFQPGIIKFKFAGRPTIAFVIGITSSSSRIPGWAGPKSCSGAGAGKTSTIIAKFEHLVKTAGYDPKRILCITFTNKAANEAQGKRLTKSTGRSAKDFPWVRTFHSAMLQIIKEHAGAAGFKNPITIYDGGDQLRLIKNILENKFNMDDKFARAIKAHIGRAKNCLDSDAYIRSVREFRKLDLIFDEYNRKLRESNAVDFDDILLHAMDLLRKNAEIREKYRELFQYIMLDEHQDSN